MDLNVLDSKLLFQLRSRMIDVKANFKNKYVNIKCPICKLEGSEDTQPHVFECTKLGNQDYVIISDNILYSDIFDDNVEKQIAALNLFKCLWNERKTIRKE